MPSMSSTGKSQQGLISYVLQPFVLIVVFSSIALLFFLLRWRRRGALRQMPRWNMDGCNLKTANINAMNEEDLSFSTKDVSYSLGSIRSPAVVQALNDELVHQVCTTNTAPRAHVPSILHQPLVAYTKQPHIYDLPNDQSLDRAFQQLFPVGPIMSHTQHSQVAPHPKESSQKEPSNLATAYSVDSYPYPHSHPPPPPLSQSSTPPLPTPTIRRYSYPFDDPTSDLGPTTPTVSSALTRRSRTFPVEKNGSLRKDSLMQTRGWRRHVMVVGGPPG